MSFRQPSIGLGSLGPRIWVNAAALFTGIAAGGALFASTVYSPEGLPGPGIMAAVQALGVFAGSFLSLPFCTDKKLPTVASLLSLCAAAACLALTIPPLQSLTLIAVGLVGLAVGLAVATTDSLAALLDMPGKAASTILKTAVFGALGATVAPIMAQGAITIGASPYLIPAGALLLGAASWSMLRSSARPLAASASTKFVWPSLKPTMALAFLFGFADNGILSLAPAHFHRAGASGWTVAAIGVAAAAGALLVQIAAVLHVEGKSKSDKPTLFYTMAATGFGLVIAAGGPQSPLTMGLVLIFLGILLDVIYGLGLIETLRSATAEDLSRGAAGYVCACALGEVVGPLAYDFVVSQNLSGLLYLAPAAVIALLMYKFRPKPAQVAFTC